jgi:hypothetical protein
MSRLETVSRTRQQRDTGAITWSSIEGWLNQDLVTYISNNLKIDRVVAVELLQEVKKFLLVAHNHSTKSRRFAPSKIVDDAWHSFILFTPIYSEFCRKILGREFTIGHVPNIGNWDSIPENSEDAKVNQRYIDAIEMIKFETGDLNKIYWPEPTKQGFQKSCSSCHGCNDDGDGSGDCTSPET